MNKMRPCLLGLAVAAIFCLAAASQDTPAPSSVPKVLQITREFTKPYKGGAAHARTESAFVQAMSKANWPTHYLGMTALSGKARSLFLTAYPSFDAWEKDTAARGKNPTLGAEIERIGIADGELLDQVDSEVFYLDEELSYKPAADLSDRRYMEISLFHVRPGHRKDWSELVKMYKAAQQKAGTSAHWAAFESMYGAEGGTWAMLSSHTSMAEIDQGLADDPKFWAAMGEDAGRFTELYAATIESSHQELFAFDPNMSYVSADWIKAAPTFWKARAAATAAPKPPAEKKAKP